MIRERIMMTDAPLKYIFYFLSALLLCFMLLSSRQAGISCDEMLHYNHSVSVYNYYISHGTDRSALNTPASHLKYYGQSYDNIVTFLSTWLKIDDVYLFRNLMSSIAGWVTVLLTAFFAVWLAGYRVGILVIILFALSPTFLGHSQNNLKDVPFALSYIAAIFFITRFLINDGKKSFSVVILLTLSISFSMSLRAGGLLLICYLYFFSFVVIFSEYLVHKKIDLRGILKSLFRITAISISAWLMSILLWPFALQRPIRNVIESYRVMAHFPSTFRQIFEGKVEWSDFMPWYYLPKSMLITVPIVVIAGLLLFMFLAVRKVPREKTMSYGFVTFAILFPMIFVIIEKSNLYSSWRQFLFLYPGIVILSAAGFHYLIDSFRSSGLKWSAVAVITIISIHPARFMAMNLPYSYMYYNQLAGGLKGAYGNYETDYYYISHKEASEWLIDYLAKMNVHSPVNVAGTYSVEWFFRSHPEIKTSVIRYEERSLYDWDYAITVNRYISPLQLKNKIWPPANAIHIIYAGNVPVCSVLERRTKDDFLGYSALNEGKYNESVKFYEKALKTDDKDEMIFYNFGAALYNSNEYQKADSVLKKGLELNPDFEPVLMYLGNIAKAQNKKDEAVMYYERLIKANRKYFEAYVGLSELLSGSDVTKARSLLRKCLNINPWFKPAIIALADTYRASDPDLAKKYDEIAGTIK